MNPGFALLPYGWGFEVDPVEQSTFTYERVHDSRIGDLFMFVDFVKFHGAPDGADDSTWCGEISPRLSLGKMLGKDLSFTPSRGWLFRPGARARIGAVELSPQSAGFG